MLLAAWLTQTVGTDKFIQVRMTSPVLTSSVSPTNTIYGVTSTASSIQLLSSTRRSPSGYLMKIRQYLCCTTTALSVSFSKLRSPGSPRGGTTRTFSEVLEYEKNDCSLRLASFAIFSLRCLFRVRIVFLTWFLTRLCKTRSSVPLDKN